MGQNIKTLLHGVLWIEAFLSKQIVVSRVLAAHTIQIKVGVGLLQSKI